MRAWERYRGASQAAFFAATVVGAIAGDAAAQECKVDSDCGAGYECEVHSSTRCAGVACAPGQTCPQPVCETVDYGRCVNAACDADADCPAPMLCHAQTVHECSGSDEDRPTCPPGVPCEPAPPPAKPTCIERTVTSCRQPYELPCTADADCGGGFRCIEEVSHWCNGSSGVSRPRALTDAVDGGAALPAPPDTEPPVKSECGTTPTGRFSCQLQVVPCDADAECPSGLACMANPSSVSCSGGSTPVGSGRDAGAAVAAGDLPTDPAFAPGPSADPIELAPVPAKPIAPPVCETIPAVPAKQCRPRHWSEHSSGGSPAGGRGDAVDEDSTQDPIAPPAPNGGGASKPATRDERNAGRREAVRKLLRDMFRNREGCSLAVREEGSALDLSWLLIAGALAAGAAARRRR